MCDDDDVVHWHMRIVAQEASCKNAQETLCTLHIVRLSTSGVRARLDHTHCCICSTCPHSGVCVFM